jgi:hypothetical protein
MSSMKNDRLAVSVVISLLLWAGAVRAESTTVSLSDETAESWTVAADQTPTTKPMLTFYVPDFPAHPSVIRCTVRVVAKAHPNESRASQDVQVRWKGQQGEEAQVGLWSAIGQETKPYVAELDPKACVPNSRVRFMFQTESQYTSWEYYGGSANQPRLIVTYGSPRPPRSGDATDWRYEQPVGYFASRLWEGQMLTSPVSYDGALYVIAPCASPTQGSCVYQITGAGNAKAWPVGSSIPATVTADSFAFVTTWGRMNVISKNAVHSCDLPMLNHTPRLACASFDEQQIAVNADETPAMGQDSSLYFKNVEAGGSLVARNYVHREIWRTMLKFTAVSPIVLSENGRHAYALADIPGQERIAAKTIALIRVDTATGDTVVHEIFHCGSKPAPCAETDKVKPDLKTLLRPAVASKVMKVRGREATVDYVFVAGNTSDLSVLQAIMYEPCVPSNERCPSPSMLWSETGKVAGAPVLSADGNSLFVLQGQEAQGKDGVVKRYVWYNTTGALLVPEEHEQPTPLPIDPKGHEQPTPLPMRPLLVDGGNRVYTCSKADFECAFMADGTLLGYSTRAIYDLSPSGGNEVGPPSLKTGTIYSANHIIAPATPGVTADDRVILKGQRIGLPNEFRWPLGATLQVQSVPVGQ